MSDKDNITLPRELAEKALEALEHFKLVFGGYREEVKALRTHLAAPSLAVTVDPRLTPDEATAISSALAAPRPEIQVMVDPAALTAAAAYVPVRIVTPDDAEIAQAAKFEKAYQNNRAAPPAAATEPVAKACWACNGKGYLRDIDTAGLLPCVVCKPQENKA